MAIKRKFLVLIYLGIPLVFVIWLGGANLIASGKLQTSWSPAHRSNLISLLYPEDRAGLVTQISAKPMIPLLASAVYFDIYKTPINFDACSLQLTYGLSENASELRLGLPAGADQYRQVLLTHRLLGNVDWSLREDNFLKLWQKDDRYASIADFLTNPPHGEPVLVHPTAPLPQTYLIDYRPGYKTITIPHSLRGQHDFLTYIDHETLNFSFEKVSSATKDPKVEETALISDFLGNEVISINLDEDHLYQLLISDLPTGRYRINLQLDGNTLLHHITTTQNKLILRDHVRLADDGANEGTDLDATFSFIGGDLDISPFDQSSSFTAKIAGQPVEIPVPANNLKESLPSEAVTQPIDITVPATGSLLISRSGYFSWKKTNQFFNTVSPNVTILDERTTPEQVAQAKYILARQADLDSHTGDLYQSHIELSPSTLFFDKAKQGWTFALMTPKLAPQTTGALLGQVDLTWYRPPLSIAELRNLFDKIWTKLIQQK